MESEKIKIVIIEDEFVIAEDMRTRLEEHGYEVSAVFDRGGGLGTMRTLPRALQPKELGTRVTHLPIGS